MELRRHRFIFGIVLAVALLPTALAGLKSFSGAPGAPCACNPHSAVCPHNHHAAASSHCRFPDGRPQSGAGVPCMMSCDIGIQPVVVAHPFLLSAPVPAVQPLAETALLPAGPTEAVLFIPEPHSPPPRPC